jgi:hypothetical protein
MKSWKNGIVRCKKNTEDRIQQEEIAIDKVEGEREKQRTTRHGSRAMEAMSGTRNLDSFAGSG